MHDFLSKYKFLSSGFILIVIGLASVLLSIWSANNNWYRYFSVGLVVFTIVMTGIAVSSKRRSLTTLFRSGGDVEMARARMKLFAEMAAGFALAAFVTVYFQKGLELDRLNKSSRIDRLEQATKQIKLILNPVFCESFPFRKSGCEAVKKNLETIFWSIIKDDETQVTRSVYQIVYALDNGFDFPTSHEFQAPVDEAKAELRALDLAETRSASILGLFPLLSLLFASHAVSSKVGLAWHELDMRRDRMTGKSPPKS